MARHGTPRSYDLGCRCEDCRAANTARARRNHARRLARKTPAHVHGTDNGYINYRCRCQACVDAHREACYAYLKKVKSKVRKTR